MGEQGGHPAPIEQDPGQAWFWAEEWQAGEREADIQQAASRGIFFDSDEEFVGSGADLVTASASSDHESGGRSGSYDYHFDRHFFDQDGVRARTPQDLHQNQFVRALRAVIYARPKIRRAS
jgi:hypothetical protein